MAQAETLTAMMGAIESPPHVGPLSEFRETISISGATAVLVVALSHRLCFVSLRIDICPSGGGGGPHVVPT